MAAERDLLARAAALLPAAPGEARRLARQAWSMRPDDPAFAGEVGAVMAAAGAAEGRTLQAESEALARNDIAGLPRWEEPAPHLDAAALYLDLMERAACNWLYQDGALRTGKEVPFDAGLRECGRDIPLLAHSMVGLKRLRHTRWAVERVLAEGVPGALVECGVWRGGTVALMRAALAAHGEAGRNVWAVDSFAGLPPPDPRFPQDADTRFDFHLRPELSVSLEEVRANIARYGLLDGQVRFLQGWFHETLPGLPEEAVAVLRVDGDLYSSTMDVLDILYPRLSPGGIVILDDYGVVVDSRRAVLDYRARMGITDAMVAIDGDGVFWRRSA